MKYLSSDIFFLRPGLGNPELQPWICLQRWELSLHRMHVQVREQNKSQNVKRENEKDVGKADRFGKMLKKDAECIFSNSFPSCRWKNFKVNTKVTCSPKLHRRPDEKTRQSEKCTEMKDGSDPSAFHPKLF